MYIQVYKLKEIPAEDYARILKRSETETDSILDDVQQVIDDIKVNGDQALVEYSKKFEDITISAEQIKVSRQEITAAYQKVDQKTVEAIKTLADNVKRFHAAQLPNKMWSTELSPGLVAGQVIIPLEKVGCYVPGGRGWFPSAVMMSVLPAKVAGMPQVYVCTPPAPVEKSLPVH
ncbi:MAG: histidinol dehydrogenase [Candidatus Syntrophopropionicum ammoniitolerans]